MPAMLVREVIEQAPADAPSIGRAARADLRAVHERDSACGSATTPFLYFKGFHALQAYRVTQWLSQRGRRSLALFLQIQTSVVFSVDIHPAARIGEIGRASCRA